MESEPYANAAKRWILRLTYNCFQIWDEKLFFKYPVQIRDLVGTEIVSSG